LFMRFLSISYKKINFGQTKGKEKVERGIGQVLLNVKRSFLA
jgi:hypothetical protein